VGLSIGDPYSLPYLDVRPRPQTEVNVVENMETLVQKELKQWIVPSELESHLDTHWLHCVQCGGAAAVQPLAPPRSGLQAAVF
jgi:hypothetical protein